MDNRHDALRAVIRENAGRTYTNAQFLALYNKETGETLPNGGAFTRALGRVVKQDIERSEEEAKFYYDPGNPMSERPAYGVVRLSHNLYIWREWPRPLDDSVAPDYGELASFADTRRKVQQKSEGKRAPDGRYVSRDKWMLVVKAQGWVCSGCGERMDRKRQVQIDHIKPKVKGGDNNLGNLMCLCWECNSAKAGRTVEELWAWNTEVGFMMDSNAAELAFSRALNLKVTP